jgi:hypothetical protein
MDGGRRRGSGDGASIAVSSPLAVIMRAIVTA